MRQITSDNIVHMEKRATNKFGLFLVFLAVIAIFGGGGFLIYKYRNQIDWEFKLPWEKSEETTETTEKGTTTSTKKKNRDLIVPTPRNGSSIQEGSSLFEIVDVKGDDRGYLFTAQLTTSVDWATITVEGILLDGYYTEATLELSDTSDIGAQVGTQATFRVNQTDLDKLNVNGFTRINVFYILEEPYEKYYLKMGVINFETEYTITNGNKGLIKVDEKGSLLIEYYKTVKADNATYIYFEAKNSDLSSNREILIKKLMINDRIYEMPEFTETVYRGARKSFYIKIPTSKIKDVEEFLVSFYIINRDSDGNNQGIYITNEYSKEL